MQDKEIKLNGFNNGIDASDGVGGKEPWEFDNTGKHSIKVAVLDLSKPTLQEAVEVLCNALRDDPSYYISWQANIAMAFKDIIQYNAIDATGVPLAIYTKEDIHKVANEAAENFLNLLISK